MAGWASEPIPWLQESVVCFIRVTRQIQYFESSPHLLMLSMIFFGQRNYFDELPNLEQEWKINK